MHPGPNADVVYVLDGGALLQKLPWTKGVKWSTILTMYVNHVLALYGNRVSVVFDAYSAGPSPKDVVHERRNHGIVGQTVKFDEDMEVVMKKEEFLSSPRNKQHFINMLGRKLEEIGCDVHHAPGDADVLIVQTAMACAHISDVCVISDDTDILILLLHQTNTTGHTVWLKPSNSRMARVWNITLVKPLLGDHVCECILFVHALTGCDTTSRLYGQGKGKAVTEISYVS